MTDRRQVLVIGAGRFGTSVATELERMGHEVLVVDRDAAVIEAVADQVTHAVVGDATDADTLRELGVADFDVVVVAIGVDERSSILTTVQLKRAGAKFVLVKADTELLGDILSMVGADRIVYPELDTGTRTAHNLTMLEALDYFDVGPGYGVARFSGRPFAGRTLGELDLPGRYGLTPIFLKRGDRFVVNPAPSERIGPTDELTLAGPDPELERLAIAQPKDG